MAVTGDGSMVSAGRIGKPMKARALKGRTKLSANGRVLVIATRASVRNMPTFANRVGRAYRVWFYEVLDAKRVVKVTPSRARALGGGSGVGTG